MNYNQGWKELQLEEAKTDKEVAYAVLSIFGILALLALLFGSCVDGIVKTSQNRERIGQQIFTQEQQEYVTFFRKHNSPAPEQMAIAVTKTKRPALMAAIAVVESNGDPKAVGDSGASKGAFQVQEKYWGEVPLTAVEQALQAERILEELLSSRRELLYALSKYNTGSYSKAGKQYAGRVINLMEAL